MKRSLAGVLIILLTSCTHEPPAYKSEYVSPSTSSSAPAPPSQQGPLSTQPSLASFVDYFDRPNTKHGLGDGWDLRNPVQGTFPPPPATDGFVDDGRYTYAGTSGVHAVRRFRGTIRSMGTVGRFRSIRFGAETALAMGITPNEHLTADMLFLAAKRSDWTLIARRADGPYERIAAGRFSPKLDLNRDYRFELETTDNTVTVRVPGSEETASVSTAGLLGDLAFWQEYPTRTPAGMVFDFDTVWALEDGQQVLPVSG